MKIKRKLELLNSLEIAIVPLEKYGVTGDHVCRATASVLKSERKLLLMDIQKTMIADLKGHNFEWETINWPGESNPMVCAWDDRSEDGERYEFWVEFTIEHHDISSDPEGERMERFYEFVNVTRVTINDEAYEIDFSDVEEELDAILENECETTLNLTNEPI